jgi:arylsulfatase
LRVPKLFNLGSGPFEKADGSLLYDRWFVDHLFDQVPAQVMVAKWLESFKDFPPRAKSGRSASARCEKFMPKD